MVITMKPKKMTIITIMILVIKERIQMITSIIIIIIIIIIIVTKTTMLAIVVVPMILTIDVVEVTGSRTRTALDWGIHLQLQLVSHH